MEKDTAEKDAGERALISGKKGEECAHQLVADYVCVEHHPEGETKLQSLEEDENSRHSERDRQQEDQNIKPTAAEEKMLEIHNFSSLEDEGKQRMGIGTKGKKPEETGQIVTGSVKTQWSEDKALEPATREDTVEKTTPGKLRELQKQRGSAEQLRPNEDVIVHVSATQNPVKIQSPDEGGDEVSPGSQKDQNEIHTPAEEVAMNSEKCTRLGDHYKQRLEDEAKEPRPEVTGIANVDMRYAEVDTAGDKHPQHIMTSEEHTDQRKILELLIPNTHENPYGKQKETRTPQRLGEYTALIQLGGNTTPPGQGKSTALQMRALHQYTEYTGCHNLVKQQKLEVSTMALKLKEDSREHRPGSDTRNGDQRNTGQLISMDSVGDSTALQWKLEYQVHVHLEHGKDAQCKKPGIRSKQTGSREGLQVQESQADTGQHTPGQKERELSLKHTEHQNQSKLKHRRSGVYINYKRAERDALSLKSRKCSGKWKKSDSKCKKILQGPPKCTAVRNLVVHQERWMSSNNKEYENLGEYATQKMPGMNTLPQKCRQHWKSDSKRIKAEFGIGNRGPGKDTELHNLVVNGKHNQQQSRVEDEDKYQIMHRQLSSTKQDGATNSTKDVNQEENLEHETPGEAAKRQATQNTKQDGAENSTRDVNQEENLDHETPGEAAKRQATQNTEQDCAKNSSRDVNQEEDLEHETPGKAAKRQATQTATKNLQRPMQDMSVQHMKVEEMASEEIVFSNNLTHGKPDYIIVCPQSGVVDTSSLHSVNSSLGHLPFKKSPKGLIETMPSELDSYQLSPLQVHQVCILPMEKMCLSLPLPWLYPWSLRLAPSEVVSFAPLSVQSFQRVIESAPPGLCSYVCLSQLQQLDQKPLDKPLSPLTPVIFQESKKSNDDSGNAVKHNSEGESKVQNSRKDANDVIFSGTGAEDAGIIPRNGEHKLAEVVEVQESRRGCSCLEDQHKQGLEDEAAVKNTRWITAKVMQCTEGTTVAEDAQFKKTSAAHIVCQNQRESFELLKLDKHNHCEKGVEPSREEKTAPQCLREDPMFNENTSTLPSRGNTTMLMMKYTLDQYTGCHNPGDIQQQIVFGENTGVQRPGWSGNQSREGTGNQSSGGQHQILEQPGEEMQCSKRGERNRQLVGSKEEEDRNMTLEASEKQVEENISTGNFSEHKRYQKRREVSGRKTLHQKPSEHAGKWKKINTKLIELNLRLHIRNLDNTL